jgi:hypothetical protein
MVCIGDRAAPGSLPRDRRAERVLGDRFEREGEERFARWIGAEGWQEKRSLDRLFADAARDPDAAAGGVPAPPETVALWVDLVKSMGPDELEDFERRTFDGWDRASLGELRRAIDRRSRELAE